MTTEAKPHSVSHSSRPAAGPLVVATVAPSGSAAWAAVNGS